MFSRKVSQIVSVMLVTFIPLLALLLQVWDIAEREIRYRLHGHTRDIRSLDFSKDSKFIISGSNDGSTQIWDMKTGGRNILSIIELEDLDPAITSIALSPDNRWVAIGSHDTTVRIWDTRTGCLVERLRGHMDSISSVAFNPDGDGIVTRSFDKFVKYWDIKPMIRAVDAKIRNGEIAMVEQNRLGASDLVPILDGKGCEGGEIFSVCSATFVGDTVSYSSI